MKCYFCGFDVEQEDQHGQHEVLPEGDVAMRCDMNRQDGRTRVVWVVPILPKLEQRIYWTPIRES